MPRYQQKPTHFALNFAEVQKIFNTPLSLQVKTYLVASGMPALGKGKIIVQADNETAAKDKAIQIMLNLYVQRSETAATPLK